MTEEIMKLSDLMVGNYIIGVDIKGRESIEVVDEIDTIKINSSYRVKGVNWEVYEWSDYFAKPILLTEEWLQKFGFKKEKRIIGTGINEKREFYFLKEIEGHFVPFQLNILGDGYILGATEFYVNIKYVHQLQNLYYALTGQKLILK